MSVELRLMFIFVDILRRARLLLVGVAFAFTFVAGIGTNYAWGCYSDYIQAPAPFMGNDGEVLKLGDGSIWQVKYAYEYLYEYYPNVVICPGINKLIIGDVQIDVVPLSGGNYGPHGDVIESKIDGTFEGWSGETIVILTNGQVWQQNEYY